MWTERSQVPFTMLNYFNACEKNTLPTVWAYFRELQVLDSPGGAEGKFPTDICIECKIYN